MSHSRGEIASLATKAARGAGMSWGLAEETGQAVAWLSARGVSCAPVFADYLDWRTQNSHDDLCPHPDLTGPVSGGGTICPFILGAFLTDGGVGAEALEIGPVAYPIFLLPFLSGALRGDEDRSLACAWPGAEAVLTRRDLWMLRDDPAALGCPAATVQIAPAGSPSSPPRPVSGRIEASLSDLNAISRFAHRTYAPATEASRVGGAGAGLTDND